MITTTDIANILYKDCGFFGIKRYQKGNIPVWDGTERVTIHAKKQSPEKIWKKCYVEVNICIPDKDGKANLIRLQEVERMALQLEGTGVYDGTRYVYSIDSLGTEEDISDKYHYVNVRILFEVLNVKL